MTTSIRPAAVALALLLLAVPGTALAAGTDTGSTPAAVTPAPSTGAKDSTVGSDTPSSPKGTTKTDSPAASPRSPASRKDGSEAVTPGSGGTGTTGTGTYGSTPYGLGSTPTGK